MNISRTISGGVYGLRIKAFTGSGNAAGGKYGIYQDGSVETNHFNDLLCQSGYYTTA